MKRYFKYILIAAIGATLISCDDVKEKPFVGKGDAVVGFESAALQVSEGSKSLKLAIVFTGEPKSYPITVDVETTVPEDKIQFTQQKGLKLTEHNNSFVELLWNVDDDIKNDTPISYTFTLTNLHGSGATLSDALATITVTLKDNDSIVWNWEQLAKTWPACQDYAWGASGPYAADGGIYAIEIAKVNDTTCKLSNLWDGGNDLTGTVDFSARTITFASGQLVYDATANGYGQMPLIYADPTTSTFNMNNVVATMNDDGTVTLDKWGMLITEGEYANYVYDSYYTVLSE